LPGPATDHLRRNPSLRRRHRHAESTPYQRIVVTRWRDDLRLFLNNNLQFSSHDEYRYHEALVHPGLASLPGAKRVLVLGGGDGLAVREVLKYPQVESVTLVDLDPAMTDLFSTAPALVALNQGRSSRSGSGWSTPMRCNGWKKAGLLRFHRHRFSRSDQFRAGQAVHLGLLPPARKTPVGQGLLVVQSTSPLYARQSYWCVVTTLESVGFKTAPYHAQVPSFGEWGYIIAGRQDYVPGSVDPRKTRF
jgi:spermidine synthase